MPLSRASEASLASRAMTLEASGLSTVLLDITESVPDPEVKIHVDYLDESYLEKYRLDILKTFKRPGDYFYDLGDPMWTSSKCQHRHDPTVCRCQQPIYHVGQDETIFKQNALPSYYWTIKGRLHLRPKSEGQGVMVSALCDEHRGFGLALTDEETEVINQWRAANNYGRAILPG